MSSVVRALLLGSAIFVLYLMLFAPARLQRIGFHAKRVGYAYVAAIVISAALRLLGYGI